MAALGRVAPVLLLGLGLALGGCSMFSGWFGSDEAKPEAPPTPEQQAEQPAETAEPGPFAAGVLNTVVQQAPAGTPSQLLAQLAAEFGWEDQVAGNPGLQDAILGGQFEQRVEPVLLGLFFQNGFSVLPVVGEGHQFNRDTVVRGALGSSRLLVSTRDKIRIIFLRPVQNVEIVYYQDGVEPQVFSVSEQAVVAVRQSLSRHYLR